MAAPDERQRMFEKESEAQQGVHPCLIDDEVVKTERTMRDHTYT